MGVNYILLLLSCCIHLCGGSDNNGRFSFSLTTFDQNGKLSQVERASRAAFLGTPIVAICAQSPNKAAMIHLAAPQVLPNKRLMMDDGTARFAQISDTIVVAHTGVSADGRIAIAAGQRMAVEHEFTFDEAIPVEVFLEEMSLLFQEYTMKAGARPFGCALLVGSLETGKLYLINPSGSIETLGPCGAIGSFSGKLQTQVEALSNAKDVDVSSSLQSLICNAMDEQLRQNYTNFTHSTVVVKATFTKDNLSVESFD